MGVGDLGPGSTWQIGPEFLSKSYEDWPRTSEADARLVDVPQEEARVLFGTSGGNEEAPDRNPVKILIEAASTQSKLGAALDKLAEHVLRREKLEMAVRTMARVISAVLSGDREGCRKEPSVKSVELAVQLLLRMSSRSAVTAFKSGKLRGLGAEVRGGIVWVSGRIRGEQLAVLLGSPSLPVLLPSEPMSRSIMHKSHREDHRRGPRDAAARSRRAAWITSATRLAKNVA